MLPDDKGSDCSTCFPGRRLRILDRPDHSIVGVVGEPTGRRLVTIERSQEDPTTQRHLETMLVRMLRPPSDFHVYLWDADHLDRPIATLPVARRADDAGARTSSPLVAISPDGKTVAVASFRGTRGQALLGAGRQPAHDGKVARRREGSKSSRRPSSRQSRWGRTTCWRRRATLPAEWRSGSGTWTPVRSRAA